eukprot:GHVP01027387.1.p1 GENE.GHVP01027387.1~~GHVP01027387.1.p1  ORF type:complete len:464 (-),score=60.22 GHVP01027387.1:313-1704(-)
MLDGECETMSFITEQKPQKKTIGLRTAFPILCAIGICVLYADRGNISLAIIKINEEFLWSSTQKGTILSAFFYGYFIMQILSGWMADVFGGVKIVFICSFLCGIGFISIPFTASLGFIPLCICRVFIGVFEGCVFPVFHSMMSSWIPPKERTLTIGAFVASMQIGQIMSNLISSMIMSSYLGWRWVFYISGISTFIWAIIWRLFMTNTPQEHALVSENELKYIEDEINKESNENEEMSNFDYSYACSILDIISETGGRKVPWKEIFTSTVVWATFFTSFANSWCFFVFQQWLPTYYSEVFGTSSKKTGISIVIPYIFQCFIGTFLCLFGDRFGGKEIKKRTRKRKIIQSIAMLIPGICLLLVCLSNPTYPFAISLFILGISFNSFSVIGVQLAHFDLGPKYAGVLYGLINTVCILSGLCGIKASGWLLQKHYGWNAVWGVCSFNYFIGVFIWCCFYDSARLLS